MKNILRILAFAFAVFMLTAFLPVSGRASGWWDEDDDQYDDEWYGEGYWDEDGNYHPYIDTTEYVPYDDDEQMPDWYPDDLSSWTFTPASPDAPRVVDNADILTDEEEALLSAKIAEATADGSADIVIFTDTSTHGVDISVYAADFYDFSGYGAGPDHTGFCLCICMDPAHRSGWCCTTGRARNLYTEDVANRLDDELYPLLQQGRYYDGFDGWVRGVGELINRGGLALPDWYPESIHEWEFVPAAQDAPRVVDNADLLTPAEEAELEALAKAISDKNGADIVLFTDTSTHAFLTSEYASDFFKYNGYGRGAGRDGMCLLISRDPNNPGMGKYVSDAYSSRYGDAADRQVNPAVYENIYSGKYLEAYKAWLECVDNIMDRGVPFPPEWYPSQYAPYTRQHDASAPRVDDRANMFTAEQIRKLTEKAAKIAKKRGVDVVIHTSDSTFGYDRSHYVDSYYKYNGYGAGDSFDGALFSLFDMDGRPSLSYYGNVSSKLTDTNREKLYNGIAGLVSEGRYYDAANRWLNYLNLTLATGRTPSTPGEWGLRGALAGVVSMIASAISSAKAKRSMRSVSTAYEANDHLVRDSLRIDALRDEYTHSTETTIYSPVARESSSGGGSSGGSSSGGSSYSGSYSGSSGTSHTGSGRDF